MNLKVYNVNVISKGDDEVQKIELSKARDDGLEIAQILRQLKDLGFSFSEYQEGFLNCLLTQCRTPTRNKQV